jgi:hypothetical protein
MSFEYCGNSELTLSARRLAAEPQERRHTNLARFEVILADGAAHDQRLPLVVAPWEIEPTDEVLVRILTI